ncbi:alpha/beta hydrolase [Streptococcus pacificus]|uniref:Alpha/beta hydrolase n=1 Tax=Streptococcus pacificus TaxID=2740577 RepID=A0ABS0ZGL6_9STRE|nr:alpha/beta hydrolase [Streptococcus pacificus]MBJ8325155.1 alpha/beta hydrolase [Streptococcus pacificus]
MEHIFKKGLKNAPVLVLLHGTGGDERSLLSIAEFLNPEASVLSLRGEVNEYGALRFFKRLEEGLYDVDDLNYRGGVIRKFIEEMAENYQFDLKDVVLVGFSNGSNMAINLLLADHTPFHKGILFAPMYPVDTDHLTQLKDKTHVFISMGEEDPICSLEDSRNVVEQFEKRGANVDTFWVNSHEINLESLKKAKDWLDRQH